MKRVGVGLGVLLLALVLWPVDAGELLAAVERLGPGALLVAAWHLLPVAVDGLAWNALERRIGAARAVYLTWLAQSASALLPVLQLGGDLLRVIGCEARLGRPLALASVVVDTTLAVLSQALFTLLGIAGLAASLMLAPATAWAAVAATLVGVLLVAAFAVMQRSAPLARLGRGLDTLAPIAGRLAGDDLRARLAAGGAALDGALAALWREPGPLLECLLLRLASWVLGAGELAIALAFLEPERGLAELALLSLGLEALIQVVRSAAFVSPGALGFQEAGYAVLGGALGLSLETSLALALVKRASHLLTGLPALLPGLRLVADWRAQRSARALET